MAHAAKMCALLEQLQQRLQEALDRVRAFERKDVVNFLLQVSRAIDHAVASNQKPATPQKVLDIFKMITKLKDDDYVKPSMMVFLLAIKGACRAEWFKPSEADELLSLYDQCLLFSMGNSKWVMALGGSATCLLPAGRRLFETIDSKWNYPGRKFCCRGFDQYHMREFKVKAGYSRGTDSIIAGDGVCDVYWFSEPDEMLPILGNWYCPRIKLVSVILSFITKKEYETRGCDFVVTQLAAKTKLSLFIIQTENKETSACLVTPNSLSFILNGRGVDRRSSLQNFPETGPLMPSDVTHLLRLGNNFIQVVGESPGKYLAAITTTSMVPFTSASVELAEYIVPSATGDGTDDEVVEAGSRVSLRCPISHKRIRTPVKGYLCRHHQCFDLDSYVDMNEIRPVWRCPCCNSNVNCQQLRLDKRMKQILKDVDERNFEVIINQDGSWVPSQSSEPKEYTARCSPSADGESNKLPGADLMLENGIIDLSDDDEMSEPMAPLEAVMSPRAQSLPTSTPSSSEGQEDRKPDVGGTRSLRLLQSAAVSGASIRERLNTAAGYNVLNDSSGQTGPPASRPRGVTEANGGVRHIQNPAPTTHLWSGGSTSAYASSLPSVQQPGSRASSQDRYAYIPAAAGQTLQGVNHALAQRSWTGTLPQNVYAGAPANGSFIATTSQLQPSHFPSSQVGSEQAFHHDTLYQQQSHDLLRQMQLNSNIFRAPVEMDAQWSQRRGPRNGVGVQQGTVTNEHGLARGGHMQQSGSANPTLTEQSQHNQTYPNVGHNLDVSRPDYWQAQRIAQLQQAALGHTNSRGSAGGRSPPVGGVPFVSPSTVATAGAQQVANPRITPRVVNMGSSNISTTPGGTPSNTTGVATPQVTNWRPAGRMRGSVSGGYVPGNRVGVNSAGPQPGPVNRTRVPAAPNTASLPLANSMNVVSPNSANSLPASVPVLNLPTEAGRISAYNTSRLPPDEFTVSEAFLTPGEMLQDLVWPTLGPDQVDSIGPQDVERWFEETMFTNLSSPGL